MRIEVRKFVDDLEYKEYRFEFFKKVNGYIDHVYTDSNGIPMIGMGYSLLVLSGGFYRRRGAWKHDLAEAGVDLAAVDLDAADKMLSDITVLLNQNKPDALERIREIIPPLQQNENPNAVRRFGVPILTEPQVAALFNISLAAYDDYMVNKLGPSLKKAMDQSWEMVALLSLIYSNGGLLIPGLQRALRGGDRSEAWFQIRYNCNRLREPWLTQRRYFESHLFGIFNNDGVPTESEALAALKMFRRRKMIIEPYEKEFEKEIAVANQLFGLEPPDMIRHLAEILKSVEPFGK